MARNRDPLVMRAIGSKGGQRSWRPGGKHWQDYVGRLRTWLQQLVPTRATFTRAEVLSLCIKARQQGYHAGYCARDAQARRQGIA